MRNIFCIVTDISAKKKKSRKKLCLFAYLYYNYNSKKVNDFEKNKVYEKGIGIKHV